VPVLEVVVVLLESEFDIQVVILVLSQAKAVALESVAVRHPSIAQVDLAALGEDFGLALNYEIVILRNVL